MWLIPKKARACLARGQARKLLNKPRMVKSLLPAWQNRRSGRSDNPVQERRAAGDPAAVFSRQRKAAIKRTRGQPADVRRQDDIWQGQQSLVGDRRLGLEDVQAGTAEMA